MLAHGSITHEVVSAACSIFQALIQVDATTKQILASWCTAPWQLATEA